MENPMFEEAAIDDSDWDDEEIVIDVGGTIFTLPTSRILIYPDSKLAKMLTNFQHYDMERGCYYLDRNPDLVNLVFDAYRFDVIHTPSTVCGNSILEELEFWNLSSELIANCCIGNIVQDLDKLEAVKCVQDDFSACYDELRTKARKASGLQKFKLEAWLFIEYPMRNKNRYSKLWSIVYCCLIISSVLVLAFETYPPVGEGPNETNFNDTDDFNFKITIKVADLVDMEKNPDLAAVDMLLNCIFTIEFLFRFYVTPRKRVFCISFLNIVDFLSIFSYWVSEIMVFVYSSRMADNILNWTQSRVSLFIAIYSIQAVRIFRIFQIAKINTGLRVLLLVLRRSATILMTLSLFLFVGMCIFSFIMYYAELHVPDTFPDIARALWWSVTTVTTVGYGDLVPTGLPGRLVAVCCGVVGIIFAGMSIPLMSGNFNLYYNYVTYYVKNNLN